MKNIYFKSLGFSSLLAFSGYGYAQTPVTAVDVSNIPAPQIIVNERVPSYTKYKVEFEIKGIEKIDMQLLDKIDFEKYIPLRKQHERVEVTDDVTGKTLIIYSKDELKIVREPDYIIIIDNKNKKQD